MKSGGGGGDDSADDGVGNDAPVMANKSLRPDWIDDENKIFINKLNFICKNFDKNHLAVSINLTLCVNKINNNLYRLKN